MPKVSERQALIRALLLATEGELESHFPDYEICGSSADDGLDDGEDLSGDILDALDGSDTIEEADIETLLGICFPSFLGASSGSSSGSYPSSGTSTSESTSSSSSSSSESSTSSSSEGSPSASSNSAEPELLDFYLDVLIHIMENRVLNPSSVPKIGQLSLVLLDYKEHSPNRFRRNLRVSPAAFDGLVEKLESHPTFHNQSLTAKQLPVEIQLAIALYRFGHDGNSASVESIAQWAGVSAGMVVKATRRVIIAILSLHDTAIHWPTAEEKAAAKEWVEEHSCPEWAGGYCMVDGTLVPLFEKPGYHGEVYFDRKSNYSLNVQLVTLPNLRIIDYSVGYCGSAHDSTVFKHTQSYEEQCLLFACNEWMWADSAYALERWCVTPYKKPLSNIPDNCRFNYHLLRVRIKSEHAMGYLKGRFCSLRGLCQQINSPQDHAGAVAWIKTCLVLHTLIFDIEHGLEDTEFVEELICEGMEDGLGLNDVEGGMLVEESQRETQGQQGREELKMKLFKYLDLM